MTSKRGQQTLNSEVRLLMIGFGDAASPLQESVDVLEDLLTNFITQWASEAQRVSIYAKPKTAGN